MESKLSSCSSFSLHHLLTPLPQEQSSSTMATQFLILTLLIFYTTLTFTTARDTNTGFVGSPDPKALGLKEKLSFSHFRFYFHERFAGSNPTSVFVVPPVPKYNSSTLFGAVGFMDTALTVGPEPTSKVVGRIEGLVAGTSQREFILLVVLNFVLTEGKYNGSTITVLGRNRVNQNIREIPVIGGTGVFRFATGYAETNTIFLDPKTRSTIEYNIYVSHYC